MKIWKVLAVVVLALTSIASAQIDVNITSAGPVRDLARNVAWQQGQGGISNAYIFKPTYQFEDVTLYATSYGPTLGAAISYQVWGTGDPTCKSFVTPSASCLSAAIINNCTGCSGTLTIATTGTAPLVTFTIENTALVYLSTSASTINATGSLFMVESQRTAKGGALPNTAGGALQASTAGAGFLWTTGIFGVQGDATGTASTFTAVANTILVYQLELTATVTVRSVTIDVTGINAASSINAALYTLDGNTKLFDANLPSTVAGFINAAITPTVIPPGVYWFAFSNTGQPNVAFAPTMNMATQISGVLNKTRPRMGQAANTTSGGVMPATLGVITAQDAPGGLLPVFLLEV